jgi:uncharacterized membrane protein
MTTRRAIMGLSLLGFADALYMLAYHEGWIDRMWCPFFGEGCEVVGRSPEARHAGVPNAAAGAAAYAGMAALAAIDARVRNARTPDRGTAADAAMLPASISWLPAVSRPALGLAGISTAAVAASAALTWEMGTRVRAWCFWCLMSAGINAALCALAWSNISESMRRIR